MGRRLHWPQNDNTEAKKWRWEGVQSVQGKGPRRSLQTHDSASSRKCELVQERAAMELCLKSN